MSNMSRKRNSRTPSFHLKPEPSESVAFHSTLDLEGLELQASDDSDCILRMEGLWGISLPIMIWKDDRGTEDESRLCASSYQFWFSILEPLLRQVMNQDVHSGPVTGFILQTDNILKGTWVFQNAVKRVIDHTVKFVWFAVSPQLMRVIEAVVTFMHLQITCTNFVRFSPGYYYNDHCRNLQKTFLIYNPTESLDSLDMILAPTLSFNDISSFGDQLQILSMDSIKTGLQHLWSTYFEPSDGAECKCFVKEEVQELSLDCLNETLQTTEYDQALSNNCEGGSDTVQELKRGQQQDQSTGLAFEDCHVAAVPSTIDNSQVDLKISRKKNVGVDEMLKICAEYESLFVSKSPAIVSPFRHCKLGGPFTLVECPSCSQPYKGCGPNMVKLVAHIQLRHAKESRRLMGFVTDDYLAVLLYMRDKVNGFQSRKYKIKLRQKTLRKTSVE